MDTFSAKWQGSMAPSMHGHIPGEMSAYLWYLKKVNIFLGTYPVTFTIIQNDVPPPVANGPKASSSLTIKFFLISICGNPFLVLFFVSYLWNTARPNKCSSQVYDLMVLWTDCRLFLMTSLCAADETRHTSLCSRLLPDSIMWIQKFYEVKAIIYSSENFLCY